MRNRWQGRDEFGESILTPYIPFPDGLAAEAIAKHMLGETSEWIGGRNPGFDFLVGKYKVDVKSGVTQRRRLVAGLAPVDTIGIRLNHGIEGLSSQDVDDILIVARNGRSQSSSDVEIDGTAAHLTFKVKVEGVTAFRVPVQDMPKVFQRPFTASGRQYVSSTNVDAAVVDLEPYRIQF